jgi:iron(III) transport system permease protein
MTATRARGARPLAAAAILSLLVIVVVPLAFVVLQAIFPSIGSGSLKAPFSHFASVIGDPLLWRLARNTVSLGLCVVILAALIGAPLGYLRAAYRLPGGAVWDLIFLIPFMMPPYIATLGWIMALQPHGFLAQMTGVDAGGFIFSFAGIVCVIALHVFPVVYFAVSRSVEAIGGRLPDVARVFGAHPIAVLWRVTLPLTRPALLASLLLVFAMTIEEYGTPAALGSHSGFDVLVTGIETRVADWPIDLSGASILSLLLIVLAMAAFQMQSRIVGSRSYATQSGKPEPLLRRPLGAAGLPVMAGFTTIAVLATVMPLLAVVTAASLDTLSGGLTLHNFGLRQFRQLADNQNGALAALENSLLLAVATALVTGLIGTLVAYTIVKLRVRGARALDVLAALPNTIPGIVVAVGLILAWNQPWLPLTPYNTPLILLMAYCCILLPYPIRYAHAALRQVGDNLEDAARISGATPIRAFRRIVLPLVAPSVLSAMLLVFAIASRELVASILVAPVGMQTIATFIWRQFDQGSVGLGMAMSSIALVITTSIPVIVYGIIGRRGATAAAPHGS